MKQLLTGIVAIVVIGFAAFLYRNIMQRPVVPGSPTQSACTEEAKVCPDGSAVGRTGPDCAFAACPLPNVEFAQRFSFVLPQGYAPNAQALGADDTLLGAYEKPATHTPHAIVVRLYPIPAGKSANDVILGETMFEPSGEQPQSLSEFTPRVFAGHTFQTVVVERFEGQVHSLYYLPRTNDVLRFELLERDVDWTNPSLVIRDLPELKRFEQMLGTLRLQGE